MPSPHDDPDRRRHWSDQLHRSNRLIDLLPQLADKTVLPPAILAELLHPAAPPVVRAWAATPPAWVEVRSALQLIEAADISAADREAITLARELGASVLLMDDRQARRRAAQLGVVSIGTVGLLEAAAARKLVPLGLALERLRATTFFLSDEIIEDALRRDAEREAGAGSE